MLEGRNSRPFMQFVKGPVVCVACDPMGECGEKVVDGSARKQPKAAFGRKPGMNTNSNPALSPRSAHP